MVTFHWGGQYELLRRFQYNYTIPLRDLTLSRPDRGKINLNKSSKILSNLDNTYGLYYYPINYYYQIIIQSETGKVWETIEA